MESAHRCTLGAACARPLLMSPPELTEEDLLQRVGRGDSRAFDQIYDRMAPRIFGLLRQMMHDEREAEEVLQDGFVLLWERAPAFDLECSKAFTWAVMLFRHKAIDRMRMLGRRNRLVESEVLEQTTLSAPAHGETSDGLAGERGTVVREALDELPKEQRRLIELAFLKGLTHHVIAESLGIQPGTVKTHIRNGMLRLRDLLKGGA
jgi:RNA polymerase sigma-70 factor (ECF subfamily)